MALWQQQVDGRWRLVRCASRHVTETEARYSATEIELLAVVWAVHKARLFLAGADFELLVDHKPLIPILNAKTLDELTSPRTLSQEDEETGHTVLPDLGITKVRAEGSTDPEYLKLLNAVKNGFPVDKAALDLDLHPYWQVRHDLSVEDGIVLLGHRIVVPRRLRQTTLEQLHASHQGQTRTLRRARQAVYWPQISNDVKNVVQTCRSCITLLPSQPSEPLLSDSGPSRPFEDAAADLFSLGGFEYLVLTDKFSGWPFVGRCGRSATTSDVTKHLVQWMSDVGVPTRLTTDGGPQFRSSAFASFCPEWNICHDPSSPYNPQSNGAAEAAVKAMKHLLMKIGKGDAYNSSAFREGLLEWRNTPGAGGASPAQLLFGRPTRTKVPTLPAYLQQI
ncbi:uncharacterized protein K02A2.6-like [Sycon ciliatum]|uniref:uncharacterized protein K02A2.6-like n=1 Tax=Sycon ciliatum TaxID=27933 RepID=UPI0031F69A11